MCNSINELKTGQSRFKPDSGLPSLVWIVPVVGVGIFLSSMAVVTSTVSTYLPYLCWLSALYWTYCLYQIHRVLAQATSNNYPLSAKAAAIQSLIGGPLAAFFVCLLLSGIQYGLDKLALTVSDLLSFDLPIVQSGQLLITEGTVWLELFFCTGIVACTNYRLARHLDSFIISTGANRTGIAGMANATNVTDIAGTGDVRGTADTLLLAKDISDKGTSGGGISGKNILSKCISGNGTICWTGIAISLFLVVPGCLWLLKDTTLAARYGLEQDWQARVLLAGFIGMLGAFSTLAWIISRLQLVLISMSEHKNLPANTVLASPSHMPDSKILADTSENAA